MLTADLVRARQKGDALVLSQLKGAQRAGALAIAEAYLARLREADGLTRDDVLTRLDEVPTPARQKKIADGLRKLLLDRSTFEADVVGDEPTGAMRMRLFEVAAAARMEAEEQGAFDRDAVLSEFGRSCEPPASVEEVEAALYSDLKGAHRLIAFDADGLTGEALLDQYVLAQAQAVLLRAESVEVTLDGASPLAMRHLFGRLKFRGLLHRIERLPETDDGAAYRVTIDGPFSVLRASTKYGLALALALPAIRACGRWSLTAKVRWGKARTPLVFTLSSDDEAGGGAGEDAAPVRDEVARLLERWAKRKTPWRAALCEEVLDIPGVGVCVPDLTFTHPERDAPVHVEVLGFWSRDAVWRRVEWAEQAGALDARLLFAVPERLRVNEEVLDSDSAALYVFKGALMPKAIEAKLTLLSDCQS